MIIPDALQEPALWKYALESPPADWYRSNFEAKGWKDGVSGFGTPETPGSRVGTLWDNSDIWLRRTFVLRQEEIKGLKLEVHHDEDAEIYLNGVLAARLGGFISGYDVFEISSEAAATLRAGTNTLAAHCHQTGGGQYIDVGLVAPQVPVPEPAAQRTRE